MLIFIVKYDIVCEDGQVITESSWVETLSTQDEVKAAVLAHYRNKNNQIKIDNFEFIDDVTKFIKLEHISNHSNLEEILKRQEIKRAEDAIKI
jgi:hypothetical protein